MDKKPAKEKLILALETLLQKKSIDAISVSEIIAVAHLSRKTFYRHFKDKYDLSHYYFGRFFQDSFGKIISGLDWDDAMLCYLTICEQRASILRNAYSSVDVNGLRTYDIELTQKTYEKYLSEQNANFDDKELRFAIEIASRSGTEMVIRWIKGEFQADAEELMYLLKQTLPRQLMDYLR